MYHIYNDYIHNETGANTMLDLLSIFTAEHKELVVVFMLIIGGLVLLTIRSCSITAAYDDRDITDYSKPPCREKYTPLTWAQMMPKDHN